MIRVLQSSFLTLKVNDGVLTLAASNEATKHEHDVFNAVLLRPQVATNGNARQVETVRLDYNNQFIKR